MITLPKTVAASSLALIMLACGDKDLAGPGDPAALERGRGSVTLSGAVTHSFTGLAEFGSDYDHCCGGTSTEFLLQIGVSQSVAVRHQTPGRPDVGTHAIHPSGAPAELRAWVSATVDGEQLTVWANSGELRITSSSREALVGTLVFQAADGVVVEAAFNARCMLGWSCN